MGRFNKGLFLGGAIGAAMVWLNTTTKGKQYRTKLIDQAGDIYEKVKQEVVESGAIEKMNKNTYVAAVRKVVDKYAIQNGMADSVKETIVRLLGTQWSRFRKEIKK